jgi:hypothetical protein
MQVKKMLMGLAVAGMIVANATTAQAAVKKAVKKSKAKVSYIIKAGFVGDGTSMHCLELKTVEIHPKTINVMIDDNTDQTNANLVIGNVVEVKCVKTANGFLAKKIEGNADYNNAIGKWTCPDPIDSNKKMGVELDVKGEASSINMATLPYTRWELQGQPGKLILFGKSIGNGQTFNVETIVTISQKNGKWIMKDDKTDVVYTKEADM